MQLRRLRVEVEKNGKPLGSVGCSTFGVLSVWVDLASASVLAHGIDARRDRAEDEHSEWSFGRVSTGDVITFRVVAGRTISRPVKHHVDNPERWWKSERSRVRTLRRNNVRRLKALRRMLRTGEFPHAPPDERVGSRSLRVSVGDREFCTVGAQRASGVSVTIAGVFWRRHTAPVFSLEATARTTRAVFNERREWGRRLRSGAVVRVEVLADARGSPPQQRVRRRRRLPPATRTEVKRELAREVARTAQIEREHREHVNDLRRIEADRASKK